MAPISKAVRRSSKNVPASSACHRRRIESRGPSRMAGFPSPRVVPTTFC